MTIEIANPLEQRVADLINAEREAVGLSPVKVEVHLNSSAQGQSDFLAQTGEVEVGHIGEGGSTPGERIEAADFPLEAPSLTAENVASRSISGDFDTDEVDQMHEDLMGSEGHRANILNPDAAYVGVGLATGTVNVGSVDLPMAYLTENFGNTQGEVLVQEEADDGSTVLQAYQQGEAVGDPQPVDDPESPDDPDAEDDEEEEEDKVATAGGCFVATAAYGDDTHPDVVALRRFRDDVLVRSALGRAFIRTYYRVGPTFARLVSADCRSGQAARAFIAPLARMARERVNRPRNRS